MDTPSSEKIFGVPDGQFSLHLDDIQSTIFVSGEDLEQLKDQRELFVLTQTSTSRPQITSEVELALNFLQHLLENSGVSSCTRSFLQGFENKYLFDFEIHSLIHTLPIDPPTRNRLLSTYYKAVTLVISEPTNIAQSALLSVAKSGHISPYVVFGGQGTANATCIKELVDLYSAYTPFLKDLIDVTGALLSRLSRLPQTREYYCGRYLDLQTWLRDPEQAPGSDFVSGVTVSCPIIGLLSLAHYCVTCKVQGMTPGDLRNLLQGVTGHSQGIVVAVAIAISDSWESFYGAALMAVESLFWIGFECNQASPGSSLSPSVIQDSVSNGSGQPSCMLSVVGLERSRLDRILVIMNKSLRPTSQIGIALINTRDNFVVGGPAKSLAALDTYLQTIKADPEIDQNRVPHSKRKPTIQHQFLPITGQQHFSHRPRPTSSRLAVVAYQTWS